ncbi:LysE family transporter [Herbaspirillum sp. LeCh32-8]|uniref:LysE family transporter n=1 Tax=Herbaspirillum sp. LeCh32-8 TaxID=2821356 RepID=UPI001AE4532C|nr:LysE family transporter [Herbaspirillum sp. LeCh32-8]MBP0600015.1 LysE family transporter [Herbaspirillum sp. LeCh32-8]
MAELSQLALIAGVLLLSVISPGPNFALVSSTAMGVSRRAGVFTGLGFAAASGTWASLAIAGVGVLSSHAPAVHMAIQLAGALYLIWLGIKMLLGARQPLAARSQAGATSSGAAIRKAYLVSMTNPKSIGFYGSIFSLMVPGTAPLWFYATVVVLAALVSAGWYCSLALLFSLGSARAVYAKLKSVIESALGLFLLALGGRVLLER